MTQPDIFDDEAPWAERFPELRVLLEAYAATPRETRFSDSPEAPSEAMRSYLRIAMYYPGRAFRATAEILDTLERGVDSPEVVAELATMPPIIVPAGLTVKDALARMVPHLVAFTERGETVAAAVPETDWEWCERLPNLANFFGAHFHQDAADFHPGEGGGPDYDAIMAYYFDTVWDYEAAATVLEIAELFAMGLDEPGLAVAADGLGSDILPPRDLSHGAWLKEIAGYLAERLRAQGFQEPEPPNPAYPAHDKRAYPHA